MNSGLKTPRASAHRQRNTETERRGMLFFSKPHNARDFVTTRYRAGFMWAVKFTQDGRCFAYEIQ